jgi:hypothetical protein
VGVNKILELKIKMEKNEMISIKNDFDFVIKDL